MVQQFEKGGVKYFTGCAPSMLLSLLENRAQELEAKKQMLTHALPDLERIRNPFTVQPRVRFFQGVEGIKEIYEDTLRTADKQLCALGDFDHYFPREHSPELNDWMWRYCLRRAENGRRYGRCCRNTPFAPDQFSITIHTAWRGRIVA